VNGNCDEIVGQLADVLGAALWGGGTRAETFNRVWLDYTGGTRESWAAAGWVTAVHADDRSRCAHALDEARRTSVRTSLEVRLVDRSGVHHWHLVEFVVLLGRWFGIGRRISNQLSETRRKDQFFARVSHELRAPIAAMLLWEQSLRVSPESDVERTRALDAIHDCAVTQARLVDDLIDIARVSVGKLAVNLERIPLQRSIERALVAVTPSITERRQKLTTTVAPELGYVEGDSTRLTQIIENLLSNASKFTPEAGQITLTATRAGNEILVEVVDTGRGIAPEFLPHVFDLFSQGDATLTLPGSGLGVGLAIASELAVLHAGSLFVESAGIGHGARFSLRLPSAPPPISAPIVRARAPALDGIAILLVDDDARLLGALEILLVRAGASVTCASSGFAALAALEHSTPDVLVSDLAMPEIDGFAVVQKMRQIPRLAHVPAIALTARAVSGDGPRSVENGFAVHLRKPVSIDTLLASIVDVVHDSTLATLENE
jgi:signal transduction histidine kinase/CheY-like chemotaxis protein